MACSREADVFKAYKWATPPIHGQPIPSDGKMQWQGKPLQVQRQGDNMLRLQWGDAPPAMAAAVEDAERYLNHRSLYRKPVQVQRMVTTYRMEPHQVARTMTRSVPVSSYNYSSKSYTTSYRTETYTQYVTEYRMMPHSDWRWTTEYRVEILPSTHYTFELPGGVQLTVFDVKGQLHLQNPSFLKASTSGGTHVVVIDKNANGAYFDIDDQVMFSAWNPYDRGSVFRRVHGLRGNTWYSMQELNEKELISLSEENGQLHSKDLNSPFNDVKSKGTVLFSGFPEDGELLINGARVRPPNGKQAMTADYGIYNYCVRTPGKLDQFGQFSVDAAHPKPIILLKPVTAAMPVSLSHPPQATYYVTVTDPEGQAFNYESPTLLNLAFGTNVLDIEVDGVVIQRTYEAAEGKELDIHLINEFKKDAAEVKAHMDSLKVEEKSSETDPSTAPKSDKKSKKQAQDKSNPVTPPAVGKPGQNPWPFP